MENCTSEFICIFGAGRGGEFAARASLHMCVALTGVEKAKDASWNKFAMGYYVATCGRQRFQHVGV